MSNQLAAVKPTIKILLYTDDPEVSESNSSGKFFGLGSMMDRLKQHPPTFADLEVKLVNRSPDRARHAENKINTVLAKEVADTGQPFDEIWFFGINQANTQRFALGGLSGGPQSELDLTEVNALEAWMDAKNDQPGGGVLMTGDHANASPPKLLATPDSPCNDTSRESDFLGLGRAIGRCVPRAGQLRRWEGAPTFRAQDSIDTIFGSGLQVDRIPQKLRLPSLDLNGNPVDVGGQPHPLFFYAPNQFIECFPDHAHEGAVIIPTELGAAWPDGRNGKPAPQVIAHGQDPRRLEPLNILAAYNGDLADVGRIVADSTWHHYMNLNLTSFPHPAPKGSISDQIGQFYGNLAIWLAPRRKRLQMARAMCWALSKYTLLLEGRGDIESISKLANSVLVQTTSPCEINELLQVLPPLDGSELLSSTDAGENDQPSRDLFLGVVLDHYQQAMIDAENSQPESNDELPTVDQLIDIAFRRTFDEQEKRLRKQLDAVSVAKEKTK